MSILRPKNPAWRNSTRNEAAWAIKCPFSSGYGSASARCSPGGSSVIHVSMTIPPPATRPSVPTPRPATNTNLADYKRDTVFSLTPDNPCRIILPAIGVFPDCQVKVSACALASHEGRQWGRRVLTLFDVPRCGGTERASRGSGCQGEHKAVSKAQCCDAEGAGGRAPRWDDRPPAARIFEIFLWVEASFS